MSEHGLQEHFQALAALLSSKLLVRWAESLLDPDVVLSQARPLLNEKRQVTRNQLNVQSVRAGRLRDEQGAGSGQDGDRSAFTALVRAQHSAEDSEFALKPFVGVRVGA